MLLIRDVKGLNSATRLLIFPSETLLPALFGLQLTLHCLLSRWGPEHAQKKKKKGGLMSLYCHFWLSAGYPSAIFSSAQKYALLVLILFCFLFLLVALFHAQRLFLIFTFVAVQFHLIKLDSASSLTLHRVIFFNGWKSAYASIPHYEFRYVMYIGEQCSASNISPDTWEKKSAVSNQL